MSTTFSSLYLGQQLDFQQWNGYIFEKIPYQSVFVFFIS